MSFDWKGLIGTVAPTIAGTFGTPLAGLATATICKALGLSPKPTEEEAHTDIAMKLAGATPIELMELKKAEEQFIKDMKQLDIDLDKINAADRASARQMQIATRSWAPPVLATIITIGFFGILIGMLSKVFTAHDSPELNILIGALSTAWGMVVMFYYGSSRGSQDKDATHAATIVALTKDS